MKDIFGFLGVLEGFKLSAKQLHWSTTSKNLHLLCDELHSAIDKFQDTMAENYMGSVGPIEMGSIFSTANYSTTIEELITEIRISATDFRTPEDPALETIIGDFLVTLNRLAYLSKFQ